ncbi:hypothetical protein QTP86_029274 [Hemibagrus guttatus]|nr:hypothetical protein QTP86_029274 [Hemibagrus guttatus]
MTRFLKFVITGGKFCQPITVQQNCIYPHQGEDSICIAIPQCKIDCQVPWTTSTEQAFEQLKEALTCAPVLQDPDISLPFIVHRLTNTSDRELGAVISHVTEGEKHCSST